MPKGNPFLSLPYGIEIPGMPAGIPGISIPYGKDKKGLPLGIQLLGKHFNEQEVFNAAYALEKDYE